MLLRKVSKPILRQHRKLKAKRNDQVPGFIYAFYDRLDASCKLGLSRYPAKRRYYLSLEYSSELEVIAIAPILNMAWGEKILHNYYRRDRKYRHPSFNGYTEWFTISSLPQRMQLRIALWLVAIFVNSCYFVSAIGPATLIAIILTNVI